MKIHTHTHIRERGIMLQRNCWSTLATALVASLALLLFQPSGAAAGTIFFSDGSDSLSATLSADILARTGSSGGCTGEICAATVKAPPGFTGTVTGSPNVNISAIAPFVPEALSDTFNFVVLSGTLAVAHFNFISDSDTGPAITAVGAGSFGFALGALNEDGTVQNVGTITWSTTGGPVVDTISFQSDVERPVVTPEPATLLLLGTGLVGAALWGRRRLGRHVNG